jgi:hypothetical protein
MATNSETAEMKIAAQRDDYVEMRPARLARDRLDIIDSRFDRRFAHLSLGRLDRGMLTTMAADANVGMTQ